MIKLEDITDKDIVLLRSQIIGNGRWLVNARKPLAAIRDALDPSMAPHLAPVVLLQAHAVLARILKGMADE